MTYNVSSREFGFHPAIPHHLMDEEGVLGDTHGIDDAAGTIVRLTAVVGVRVAEDDFYTTAGDAGACAGTLTPVVVPAAHHLDSKLVHVVVVLQGRVASIERAVALLVVGVAPLVPILAQAFVATVLHSPHRVLLRFVDIEHLAAILCLVDVEHLTAADGASATGVILVADGLHLEHVLAADALVATLVEEYRGVVAVVDDGITHQLRALLPAGTLDILLGIAGGHGLRQSDAVARLDVLLPRCDVHPAHHVGPALHHQTVGVVAEPGRHADAHPRPLVRRTLGIAVYHHHAVVKPYLTVLESRLAEAGTGGNFVDGRTVGHETCLHCI